MIQPVYEDGGMEYDQRRVEFDMREREYRISSPPERPRFRNQGKDTRENGRKEISKEMDFRRETLRERMRGGQPPPTGVLVGYKYPSMSTSQNQQLPKSILKQQRTTGEGYHSPPFAQPGIHIFLH